MKNKLIWIIILVLPCLVTSLPVDIPGEKGRSLEDQSNKALHLPKHENPLEAQEEKVISVRITSSVAVDRGHGNTVKISSDHLESYPIEHTAYEVKEQLFDTKTNEGTEKISTNPPETLAGANLEYIKQLKAKKEAKGVHFEQIHPYQLNVNNQHFNESDDSIAEPSIKSVSETTNDDIDEFYDDIPLARSASLSPTFKNNIQETHRLPNERRNNPTLTTVSFNVVHDTPEPINHYNGNSNSFLNPSASAPAFPKVYNEPAKVYSEPAKIYSEPAKFYSEPAKIYSEPAKIYSEPSKIYSEPAKIYSEPARFYSQPASLHLDGISNQPTRSHETQNQGLSSTIENTTPVTTIPLQAPKQHHEGHQREKNYEVDEKVSVLTDGRSHGVQETTTEKCRDDNCKVGYVVEGRDYKKYRVEERTSDGFIVGEYGVVNNEDGALRGVRYTADSEASPRLIYDALMKFLQLK